MSKPVMDTTSHFNLSFKDESVQSVIKSHLNIFQDLIKSETNEEAKLWLMVKLNGLMAEIQNGPQKPELREV